MGRKQIIKRYHPKHSDYYFEIRSNRKKSGFNVMLTGIKDVEIYHTVVLLPITRVSSDILTTKGSIQGCINWIDKLLSGDEMKLLELIYKKVHRNADDSVKVYDNNTVVVRTYYQQLIVTYTNGAELVVATSSNHAHINNLCKQYKELGMRTHIKRSKTITRKMSKELHDNLIELGMMNTTVDERDTKPHQYQSKQKIASTARFHRNK